MGRGPDAGRGLEALTERQVANFWKKVDKSGDCWLWQGAAFGYGYGAMRVGKTIVGAHRVAYVIANGPLEANRLVRHKCNNPPCVNPAHLELGTQFDNMADRYAVERLVRPGDRMAKGGKCPNALKTHCPKGHEYTEENTFIDRRGWRSCLTCRRTLWMKPKQPLGECKHIPAGQG